MRRPWRRWTLPYELFLRALTFKDSEHGRWIVSEGIPSDLMVVSVTDDPSIAGNVYLIVASDTFDHVEDGMYIPDFRPKFIVRTERE